MNALRIWVQEIGRLLYWYPVRWFVHHLPIRFNGSVGHLTGVALYYLANERRRRLVSGVRELFGGELEDRSLRRIVRDTFNHAGRNAIENLLCDKLSKKLVEELITWEGLENLDLALSYGKGAILMHAHFGNQELIMPAVGYKGYPMNQLASRWKPVTIDRGVLRIPSLIKRKMFGRKIRTREKYPIRFIYIDKALREAIRCLRRNEILAIAMDGREGRSWITVKFLGKNWLFSPGPMHLALSTRATVIPTFILREKEDRHRLIFHRPFNLVETGNRRGDIYHNTQSFVRLLERYVRRYPCHYMKLFWLDADFFVAH